MNKYEKLNQIKECISKIEEDLILSYNNDYPDKEAIMTKNILECLKDISGLIENIIDEPSMNNKKAFFITNEQADEIILKENATIGNITDEINRVTETNNTSKITTTWITDWLLEMNILQKTNNGNSRIPTQKGREMGITTKTVTNQYGQEYLINYYSYEIQDFIYDNIDNIVKYHYSENRKKKNNHSNFFITDKQLACINFSDKMMISQIANELNKVTEENNTPKISAVWITDWLLEMNILQKDAENNRISTRLGNETGITTVTITKDNGSIYFQNRYSAKSQKFIYDNIENIIDFHYNGHQ